MNPRVEFDLQIFRNNIERLKSLTKNITFLFPVKCCNNIDVLDIVYNYQFGFDISNKAELKIIESYLDGRFISVSGPLSYELENYDYSNMHIVANSLNVYDERKGLRINFNSNSEFEFSRFGVDVEYISDEIKKDVEYIHFHNSDHRDISKCNSILKSIGNILLEFPKLQYINVGGHLEDLSFDEGINYLNEMRKIIPSDISMIVELGDFLFKNVGKLYCKVIDVRYDEDIQLVTLNFSKMANQRWAYPNIECNDSKVLKTVFYGCSCCETDVYLETNYSKLNIGDNLTFTNISPYSYQWNTAFNGIDKIDYVFKN